MFQPETSIWLGSFGLLGKELYQEKLLLPSRLSGTPHLHKEQPGGLGLLQPLPQLHNSQSCLRVAVIYEMFVS